MFNIQYGTVRANSDHDSTITFYVNLLTFRTSSPQVCTCYYLLHFSSQLLSWGGAMLIIEMDGEILRNLQSRPHTICCIRV